jgi:hypothetical protein
VRSASSGGSDEEGFKPSKELQLAEHSRLAPPNHPAAAKVGQGGLRQDLLASARPHTHATSIPQHCSCLQGGEDVRHQALDYVLQQYSPKRAPALPAGTAAFASGRPPLHSSQFGGGALTSWQPLSSQGRPSVLG